VTPELHHLDGFRKLAAECHYDSRRLARQLGVTQRHLQRLFKVQLECSPQRWLREQRMCRAREMLRTSGSVKEVAYELGFRSASQFCRDYKSWFGQQPWSERRLRSRAAPALVLALALGDGAANARNRTARQRLAGMTKS
jgi:transcriptional regulator GlxA family with amidase domain